VAAQLKPDKFLTVCGMCGGEIAPCDSNDPRIFLGFVPTDKQIYICVNCHQAYWWNERESSSPARAMKMAGKLYATVINEIQKIKDSPGGAEHTTVADTINEEEESGEDLIEGNARGEADQVVENEAANEVASAAESTTSSSPSLSSSAPSGLSAGSQALLSALQNSHTINKARPSYAMYSHKAPPTAEEEAEQNRLGLDMAALSEMMKQRDTYLLGRDEPAGSSNNTAQASSASPALSDCSTGMIDSSSSSGAPSADVKDEGSAHWLKSAYKHYVGVEPAATNWGGEFQG
jgi:hypothetical protein